MDLAIKSTYNPKTKKYFGFSDSYVPDPINYRKSFFDEGGMGLEHVMNVYVIWKFAENIAGAKKFLVDYIGNFHRAFEASEFYNFPCFTKTVPDLKKMLQHDSKGKPPDKYAVLADSLDWATNVGYPGYANAAIDDIYSNWIVNNMFAKAAQGIMSPENAVKEAEAKARDIFAKWKERKLL